MPKYLCLQRSIADPGSPPPPPSPSAMQEMYARFASWQARFKGNIVDPGGRLGDGRIVSSPAVSDGALIEIKELVGGYMIVTADDIEQALLVARECPGLVGPGSACEVIEIRQG